MAPHDADPYSRCAEFYDGFGLYAGRRDVAFFVDEARRSGGPVLELGCGTGRVAIPTARAGVEICGLDASAEMLARFREKLAAEPADVQRRVSLVQGDMRAFDLGRRFRLVTLPFRPFQHLVSVQDQLACLARVRAHLTEDGRLILDLFNPWLRYLTDDSRLEERPEGEPFALPDGRRVVRLAKIAKRDLLHQVQDVELIYEVTHADGRRERIVERFPMRYLFRYEAEHLLVRAGFEVEALYSDYERSPFGAHDPGELIFVARRGANGGVAASNAGRPR
jgi:SAM-dependent methyltransferase